MLATHSTFVAPVAFSYVSASVTTALSYDDRYASLAFLLAATAFSRNSVSAALGLLYGIGDRVGLRLRGHVGSLRARACKLAAGKLAQQLR